MAEIKTIELHIKSNVDTASKEFDNFAKSIKAVDTSATNLDATFEEVYGDLQPLTTRMGEAEDRLYELALAGKQGTQEFKDLLTSVGNYRKVQIQTDMVVDNAATTMSQKLTGSLNAAAGAFSLVQGSMALFGAESEDVEQAILKVQSAMAISQGVETIAEGAKSVRALGTAIQATSAFQKASTAAQWLWNAAMAANPIGVVVASIAALLVGGYKLIKFFQDSSAANDKAAAATKKNTEALKQQSINAAQSSNKLKSYNDQQYALAEASGMSSEGLRKLALKHKEEEVALNKKNAILAQSTFLRQRDTLAALKNSEASDEVIANQEKLVQETYKSFKKQNEILSTSYKERAALKNANAVSEVADAKAASDKAAEEAKAAREKAKEERIAAAKEADEERNRLARERGEKAREEYENAEKLAKELKQKSADTTKTENELKVEAENAEFERKKALLVAANLSTEDLDRLHKENLNKLDLEYWAKQSDSSVAATAKEKEENAKRIANDQAAAEAKLAIQNAVLDNVSGGIGILKQLGEKNKALQKAAIIAENAAGIARIIINTKAANAKAVAASPLTVGQPWVTINTISGALGVAGSLLATKKALSELGGGSASGGSVGTPSSGGAASAPTTNAIAPAAAPTFNVVGTSGQNQIAQSLGNQAPLKAYVVSGDVTTAQSLDRNIVKTASLGN
jgi:hypothetical protein